MAFPTTFTAAVDDSAPGVGDGTIIYASLFNAIEAKIGIDGSAVVTSLDYLVKNTSSIDPGHKHSQLWDSDGSPIGITVGTGGKIGIGAEAVSPTVSFQIGATLGSWPDNKVLSIADPAAALLILGENVNNRGTIYWDAVTGGLLISNRFAGDYYFYSLNIIKDNIGVGTLEFGTSAQKVIGVAVGTAPTTAPVDMAQLWVEDLNGSATGGFKFMKEGGTTEFTVMGCSGVSGVSSGVGSVKMGSVNAADNEGWLALTNHLGVTVYVPYWVTAIPSPSPSKSPSISPSFSPSKSPSESPSPSPSESPSSSPSASPSASPSESPSLSPSISPS